MDFIKNQWLAGVIVIIWIIIALYSDIINDRLLDERNELKIEIDSLESMSARKTEQINNLSKVDTIIVHKIKTIKEKEYVKIKSIDSLDISGIQQFFTERYPR
tara:strand:+ start:1357 stop:1665 length:309 start_codon:yes stop_codon:yes gene_type:complete